MSNETPTSTSNRGRNLALTAALLGWMFDGLEMGLFPLIARPALRDLLNTNDEAVVGGWVGFATTSFLIGAATGGVLFGWLGDRIGRVRAMTLSVLTYAIFSGAGGLARTANEVAISRFVGALGMGGEWSLGVALVMESWPNQSRALMAGLIGAAANVGYLLIAVVGLAMTSTVNGLKSFLATIGVGGDTIAWLMHNDGWRLLMLFGATPALLTFLIRIFVPESQKWQKEKDKGTTSNWSTGDLIGVLVGAAAAGGIIHAWSAKYSMAIRIAMTAGFLVIAAAGYLFPVVRYLMRSRAAGQITAVGPTVRRMLLGACLGGVPLLGTWACTQQIPTWSDKLTHGVRPEVKSYTQIVSGFGAIVGTLFAAYLGDRLGRKWSYSILCLASLAAASILFRTQTEFNAMFLCMTFAVGVCTASFYGWLPLYLPELFGTAVRATGQGFSFNFGRIIAAIGTLQLGFLVEHQFSGDYGKACAVLCLIYVAGLVVIAFAPETKGKPLPD